MYFEINSTKRTFNRDSYFIFTKKSYENDVMEELHNYLCSLLQYEALTQGIINFAVESIEYVLKKNIRGAFYPVDDEMNYRLEIRDGRYDGTDKYENDRNGVYVLDKEDTPFFKPDDPWPDFRNEKIGIEP